MAPRIHRVTHLKLYFIPVRTRMPLKFGPETLTSTTCLRVAMGVADDQNHYAEGWGETPLSVQWVWPSRVSYEIRHDILKRFCRQLGVAWMRNPVQGHPLEVGHDFLQHSLVRLFNEFNADSAFRSAEAGGRPIKKQPEPMPWLAALVCNSAFDIALHDAFGRLVGCPVYDTYGPDFLERDLAHFMELANGSALSFAGKYPRDYLLKEPLRRLVAWHLVGGLDPIESGELTGTEPKDGHPVLLSDWIARDGLKCLKVKLRGNDSQWDYQRLVRIAQVALPMGVEWLTADFNCTVHDVNYVNHTLDE